jgi:hypothetical protein
MAHQTRLLFEQWTEFILIQHGHESGFEQLVQCEQAAARSPRTDSDLQQQEPVYSSLCNLVLAPGPHGGRFRAERAHPGDPEAVHGLFVVRERAERQTPAVLSAPRRAHGLLRGRLRRHSSDSSSTSQHVRHVQQLFVSLDRSGDEERPRGLRPVGPHALTGLDCGLQLNSR